jgi:cellobiose phosphorylase
VVSASGAAFSWAANSRENQLTAWSNDPVSDPSPEVVYLRDEETGDVWTPTAHPIRLPDRRYIAAHGHGYSRFEVSAYGVRSELLMFVAPDAPVKTCVLTLENLSRQPRRLAVTAYVEWCLGQSRNLHGAVHHLAGRRHNSRDARAQCVEQRFRQPRRVRGHERTPDVLDRRSSGVPGPSR